MLSIYDLTVEYRENPIGIACAAPRFSWKLKSDRQNVAQRAYRIKITDEDGKIVWDSGRVESGRSVAIPYDGKALAGRTAHRVSVSVDAGGSAEADCSFETGLMDPAKEFTARYITHGFADDLEPAAVFIKDFPAHKPVKKARLYATALGVYEFTLNGEGVSDVRLAPGWTCYNQRLQYQTYDLTPYLREENRIVFTVGSGWYKGILGFYNTGNHYGERTALLAQVELTYEDGATEVIPTDESWLSTTGPVRYSEWYHGETIDLSLDAQETVPAKVYERSKDILVPQQCEPVRITQRLPAVELLHTPNGETVLDFGQNVASVYYLNSIDILAKSAELLGYEPEAREYRALYEQVLAALRAEYITPAGRLLSDTQTGLAMGLQFHICEEKDRPRFVERLCKNLENHKNHLATGFAGTRVLCRALSENGRHDLAGKVFLKEDCPGWLYHVKLGGTTVWELWDGVNPDGSFNKFEMNSLNQYAYASVGEWIYKDLCGLQPLEPGYKRSLVKPRLIEGITELNGAIETVYGRLECKKRYRVNVEIPANTTALADLLGQKPQELGSGKYCFAYATEDDFVKHKYNMETVFSKLLEHPVGAALLKQYAPDLLGNDLFLTFAAQKTMEEISAMLPPEAMQLMELVLAQCNAAEEGGEA